MNAVTDKLFTKVLTVNICESGSSYASFSRKLKLLISVEWSSAQSGHHARALVVRLTDENEPFFIYHLNLCEDDFQSLKVQQGLLVDFLAFPQKFIDLLELCLKEEGRDTPKFVLNLSTNGRLGLDAGTATLDVVETNPFKLLTHLSLKLVPATDEYVKNYLAANIKVLKEENHRLESSLRGTQNDLQGRLQNCQQDLSSKGREWEQRNRQLQSEICSLSQRHQEQLKEEQEKIMRIHREAESRWTMEKQELELKLSRAAQDSEARNSLLEASNKDLQERLHKCESNLREVRSHLVTTQSDMQQSLSKQSSLNRELQVLNMQYQEQIKANGNLKAQLSQTQQESRDKDLLLGRTQELLNTTQQQKVHFENLCEQRQTIISKKENAVKTVSEELNKGNEIIRKLQTEIKNYHTKLKTRNQISSKQEEMLAEKGEKLLRSETELFQCQERLKACLEDNDKLNAELSETKKKFEEIQKKEKSNENVISWLNKQLNDVQVGNARAPGLYNSSAVPHNRLAQQLPMMTTSTPLGRPTGISPTAHPLYRPPVFSGAGVPRIGSQMINGTNRSPVMPFHTSPEVPTISSTEESVQPPVPTPVSATTHPKQIASERTQSANIARGKPKPTRRVSSAPTRK